MAHTLYLVSALEAPKDVEARLAQARQQLRIAETSLRFMPRFSTLPWGPMFKKIVNDYHAAIQDCKCRLMQTEPRQYWKIGVTKWADPLRRDRKRYQEVFRAVQIEPELWTQELIDRALKEGWGSLPKNTVAGDIMNSAEGQALFIEGYLRDAFRAIGTFIGYEAVSGEAPYGAVVELFDQFVEWYHSGDLVFTKPLMSAGEAEAQLLAYAVEDDRADEIADRLKWQRPLWERCDQLIKAVVNGIADARAARCAKSVAEPMWA
jgi:hypothetical protein